MKRVLFVVLALLLAFSLALAGWAMYEWRQPYQGYEGSLRLDLEPGTSAFETARLLEERGVIRNRWLFWIRYAASRGTTLKAGEYSFDRPLRPRDVYQKLIRGDVLLYSVTIPEGSDRFDMARILHRDLGIDPQVFLPASGKAEAIRDLDPGAVTLEGYLFPETYRFPRGVTAEQVIAAMLGQFRRVLLTQIPAELRPPPEELRSAVALASLVEKETPASSERAVVAGVFRKRLKIGMPLQCDPTVIYAARLEGRTIGKLKLSDLEINSPYNTYRHAGLPPGPIASPGAASLLAALKPAETEFLYFVSDDRGGHFFSKTLAEHNQKVARYRREVAIRLRAERASSGIGGGSASRKVKH